MDCWKQVVDSHARPKSANSKQLNNKLKLNNKSKRKQRRLNRSNLTSKRSLKKRRSSNRSSEYNSRNKPRMPRPTDWKTTITLSIQLKNLSMRMKLRRLGAREAGLPKKCPRSIRPWQCRIIKRRIIRLRRSRSRCQ